MPVPFIVSAGLALASTWGLSTLFNSAAASEQSAAPAAEATATQQAPQIGSQAWIQQVENSGSGGVGIWNPFSGTKPGM